MTDDANWAGLPGEPCTGLAHGTPEERRKGIPEGASPGITPSARADAAPGEPMRLFVAIGPPAAVLDDLDALAGPLRSGRKDLRWTSREAWHLTLAFLGQVDQAAAARLLPRLERAARRHHGFRLAFTGAGAFPTAARANVLWCGVSGDRLALAHLAASVAAGASRAGAPPPDRGRRFQPHLTLARCRTPADVTELVAGLEGYRGPAWTADRIHLVHSRLGASEQPRYTTLASWPLSRLNPGPGG
jgi:RNA 2',3'-cyclic 3'-phosphodiesterase